MTLGGPGRDTCVGLKGVEATVALDSRESSDRPAAQMLFFFAKESIILTAMRIRIIF
jgi:hypothetical protein